MRDKDKTKQQLINELVELRKNIQELEASETDRKRTERALKESEEKFSNLAEQSPNMIFINMRRRVLYANAKCAEIMGYKKEEFYSPDFNFLTLIAPESTDLVKASFSRHMKGEEVAPYEYALISKEGIRVEAIITTKLIAYEGEEAILGIVTDITGRKRAEEKLKREKERVEEYLNIAGVMLATVDANESISMINKKGCEMLGYDEGELIGRNWFDTLAPQRIRGEIRGVFRRLMAGDIEPVQYYENPLLTKDGEERLILFHNTVIRNSNGQIVGALSSGEDVTERKRMEQELREERDRLGAFSHLLEDKINERNKEIAELKQFLQELTDSRGRFIELEPTENEEAPLIPHTLYQALVYVYSENMHRRKPVCKDLQSALGISRTTARQRINELEQLNLISVENSGRSKFLTVTIEGKNIIL